MPKPQDRRIPDDWHVSSMLRNMVADYVIGPDKIDVQIDRELALRFLHLTVLGHVELAEKLAWLIEVVQELDERVAALEDRLES
ncbi:hypothetical protein ORI20_27665 [Mycobacterium sp. CVI_P3]|uniref:Uncharacterized protein n=1 Tax=Mycobacterium pinniadriaticum TaxID=2994102 RepID=A0ABT3SM77_9MYCO|nr:hypothetical protein [Mycobacterium pinniadriaticum]MCX2934051.1 hypothetical protein [Mycobacterium pinniadriaticum]MCX2940452.1 hypothetical protein [Mycobacterium pinniadriaticum]